MKQKISKEEKTEMKQEKRSWNDMIRRMKKKGALVAMVAIIFFCSCSKEVTQPDKPIDQHQFTATVFLTPSSNVVSYELFVTNDAANRNDSFMIYAGTIQAKDIKSNPFSFGFDFKEYRCKDFVVTPGKKLYGAIREGYSLNDFGKLKYNSVTIISHQ